MAKHEFVGKTYDAPVFDADVLVHAAGEPVVAQVKGAPVGALAQVCDVCGKTAGHDGRADDTAHHPPGHELRERLAGR